MDLIVDTSAAIHAAAMISGTTRLIDMVDLAFGSPVYGLTTKARTELVRNDGADWLGMLDQLGRLEIYPNDYKTAKRRHEEFRRTMNGLAPGLEDCGLICLAEKYSLPLLTDDQGLYRAAIESKIRCADLFDFCLGAIHAGKCSRADLHDWFQSLATPSPHFMPMGWKQFRAAGAEWPQGCEELVRLRRPPEVIAKVLFG